MDAKDRFEKANQAFEELKNESAIGQLSETSNFEEVYYLLKNYFDRYFSMFVLLNPENKWYLQDDIDDILKRKELKTDVNEYEFVKSKVDSALALIEELVNDTKKHIVKK